MNKGPATQPGPFSIALRGPLPWPRAPGSPRAAPAPGGYTGPHTCHPSRSPRRGSPPLPPARRRAFKRRAMSSRLVELARSMYFWSAISPHKSEGRVCGGSLTHKNAHGCGRLPGRSNHFLVLSMELYYICPTLARAYTRAQSRYTLFRTNSCQKETVVTNPGDLFPIKVGMNDTLEFDALIINAFLLFIAWADEYASIIP